MKSIMQDDVSRCYLCGRNGTVDPLEWHHVVGGPNRRISDRDGLLFPVAETDATATGNRLCIAVRRQQTA